MLQAGCLIADVVGGALAGSILLGFVFGGGSFILISKVAVETLHWRTIHYRGRITLTAGLCRWLYVP